MRRVAANRPGLATVRGAVASRVHWQLDRLVSKGPSAVIAVACLIVIGIAVLGGVLTLAVTSGSFANRAWSSFTELDREPDAVAIVPYRDMLGPSQADAATLRRDERGSSRDRHAQHPDRERAARDACRGAHNAHEARRSCAVGRGDRIDDRAARRSPVARWGARGSARLAWLRVLHLRPRAGAPRRRCDDVLVPRSAQSDARTGELAIGLRIGREIVLNPPADEPIRTDAVTGVVAVGAGVGWNTGAVQSRMADVL
jgi:hypothetical protein